MIDISIIVPVYNAEKYLEECLESLVGQSYSSIEIILINDGSLDNSLQICQLYEKRHRNIIVINQENKGVSATRNLGIKIAKGSFVMFVDADDYVDNKMCEKLIAAQKNQDNDLIFCKYSKFSNRENAKTFRASLKKIEVLEDLSGENFNILYKNNMLNAPVCKLYKRTLITDFFDTSTDFGEDLLFNLDFLKKCHNICYIDESLYFYRRDLQESLTMIYRENNFGLAKYLYHHTLKKLNLIFGNQIDYSLVENKYAKDMLSAIQKIGANRQFDLKDKIDKINNAMVSYRLNNLFDKNKKKLSNKQKLLVFLLQNKQYRLAILMIDIKNILKRM